MYDKKPSRFLFYHKDFTEEKMPKYKNINCNEINSDAIIDKMEKYYEFRKNELSKFNIVSTKIQEIKIPSFIKNNDLIIEFNTFLYLLLSQSFIDKHKILKLKEFEFKFNGISTCIDQYLELSIQKQNINNIFIIACALVYFENKKRLKGYLLYNKQKLLNKKDLSIIQKLVSNQNQINIFYKNSNIQEYLLKSCNITDQIIIDIINWKMIQLSSKDKEFK